MNRRAFRLCRSALECPKLASAAAQRGVLKRHAPRVPTAKDGRSAEMRGLDLLRGLARKFRRTQRAST